MGKSYPNYHASWSEFNRIFLFIGFHFSDRPIFCPQSNQIANWTSRIMMLMIIICGIWENPNIHLVIIQWITVRMNRFNVRNSIGASKPEQAAPTTRQSSSATFTFILKHWNIIWKCLHILYFPLIIGSESNSGKTSSRVLWPHLIMYCKQSHFYQPTDWLRKMELKVNYANCKPHFDLWVRGCWQWSYKFSWNVKFRRAKLQHPRIRFRRSFGDKWITRLS